MAAVGRLLRSEQGAVLGQQSVLTGLVVALLVRGHVLLEGVPGVAKTLLVKALAAALDLGSKRVQFTPDLMPSDVTGQVILEQGSFRFREGPVFTNLLLADEVNRTPPKTQAALLEAMQERQVTVEGRARRPPEPFVVVATQNPIEYEGTYPLPEAQLDRFMLKLSVTYPTAGVNAVLVALAAVDHARAARPSTVGVERHLPGVGHWVVTPVVWVVRNPGRRSLRVALADELAPSLRPTLRRAAWSCRPGAGRPHAPTCGPRGESVHPPPGRPAGGGPMGLAARQGRRVIPGQLRVYPPFRSREEADLWINRARLLEVGLRSAPGRGGGTEFETLRDYGVDDEFRRIDWAATARAGRPVVRTGAYPGWNTPWTRSWC